MLDEVVLSATLPVMAGTLIGHARRPTDTQNLTAQRDRLRELGVTAERTCLDHGLTGTERQRPGLDQTGAAVRAGDTLVASKLRPARPLGPGRSVTI